MRALTKAEGKDVDEMAARLADAKEDVERAVDAVNAEVGRANDAIRVYNEVLNDARELAGDIVARMDDYAGGRSDKWRDSDAGRAFEDWKGEWENLELGDLDTIEDVETPDMGHDETLGMMRREVDG